MRQDMHSPVGGKHGKLQLRVPVKQEITRGYGLDSVERQGLKLGSAIQRIAAMHHHELPAGNNGRVRRQVRIQVCDFNRTGRSRQSVRGPQLQTVRGGTQQGQRRSGRRIQCGDHGVGGEVVTRLEGSQRRDGARHGDRRLQCEIALAISEQNVQSRPVAGGKNNVQMPVSVDVGNFQKAGLHRHSNHVRLR